MSARIVCSGTRPSRYHSRRAISAPPKRPEQAILGLRRELADVKTELQERKVIDRAKGLLMQRQGLSEPAAYDKLRKAAMNKGLRLAEVAQRMLDAADLLG